jgi:DNA-binding NtrC family response regulator
MAAFTRLDRILVVDDDDELRRMLVDYLTSQGYTALGTRSTLQAHEALKSDAFDIVMADLRLEDGSGLDLLRQVRQLSPRTYGILMTGYATMDTAVEAIRIGLFDYLIKPVLPAQLDLLLQRLESLRQLQSENSYLRQAQVADASSGNVVWGRSVLMQDILEMVKKVAATHATVLIQGESGTGKEVVAHAIMQNSPRANMPFVKVNCAAVPETLLESEFFGHEKGAFTGAVARREGRFETANGGTLLLDEIAEIPMSLQVKLLRVLQEREFERVGGNKTIRVDVRLIASTNRDLQEAVRLGHFREDLYYRLNVVPINLPPLRLRGDDLSDLIEFYVAHFARKHGKNVTGVSPDSMERLKSYRWPGNVRELQNTLERAVIMSTQDRGAGFRPGRKAGNFQQHHRGRDAADRRRDGAAPDRLHAAADEPQQDPRGGKAGHQPAHAAQQAAHLPRDGLRHGQAADMDRCADACARASSGRVGVVKM